MSGICSPATHPTHPAARAASRRGHTSHGPKLQPVLPWIRQQCRGQGPSPGAGGCGDDEAEEEEVVVVRFPTERDKDRKELGREGVCEQTLASL